MTAGEGRQHRRRDDAGCSMYAQATPHGGYHGYAGAAVGLQGVFGVGVRKPELSNVSEDKRRGTCSSHSRFVMLVTVTRRVARAAGCGSRRSAAVRDVSCDDCSDCDVCVTAETREPRRGTVVARRPVVFVPLLKSYIRLMSGHVTLYTRHTHVAPTPSKTARTRDAPIAARGGIPAAVERRTGRETP